MLFAACGQLVYYTLKEAEDRCFQSERVMAMKKRVLKSLVNKVILGLLLVVFSGPCVFAVDIVPCDLFTQADAEALFAVTVPEGVTRDAMTPAGKSCRYTFEKEGASYGLTLKICTTRAIAEEGIFDSASDVFERQVKARQGNAEAAKKFKKIEAFGEVALWEGTALWVLDGDVLLIITVRSPLDGSFESREAMDAAQEAKNLSLSLEVAETALSRL